MNNYVKTSVPRPVGNPGNGINPKDVLTLIDIDDLVYFPPRDGAGVVLEGDIVVKPSAYSTDLYLTPGTVELSSNGEGETDAKGFTPSVKGKHPGTPLHSYPAILQRTGSGYLGFPLQPFGNVGQLYRK